MSFSQSVCIYYEEVEFLGFKQICLHYNTIIDAQTNLNTYTSLIKRCFIDIDFIKEYNVCNNMCRPRNGSP